MDDVSGMDGSESRSTRWVGVGHSLDPDPRVAGAAAATEALNERSAALVIVFASDSYDLETLVAAINDSADDAPLIGCSTAGEIATSTAGHSGVVVAALGGEGFKVATSVRRDLSRRLRGSGTEVAACLSEVADRPHKVLMVLTDGLAGDQQEIVRGIYSVAGAGVPLVGGCAGDDMKMTSTHQFCGREVLGDAVVAAAIGSDAPFGIGVRHGWETVAEPMTVTKSSDNRVYSLDNRPALDVYLEHLDAPEDAHTDPAAFTNFAMTHPLGLQRRSDEPHVRFIAEADFEERSLVCIAEVPRGAAVWLMEGDDASVLSATDDACRDALEGLGSPPLGFIAFDCIARRGVLGDAGIQREAQRISAHAGGAPVAGFYTYGEIARTRGISGFHNQTLVVLAVA